MHQSLGWVAGHQDRRGDALGHAERALALFEATGNRAGQAALLNNAGLVPRDARRRAASKRALPAGSSPEPGTWSRRDEADAWDCLGYAEHQLGHHGDPARCYQKALRLFRELGDRFNEAAILTHLGDTHHAASDRRQARDAWQQALDILDGLHQPRADQVRAKLRNHGEASLPR